MFWLRWRTGPRSSEQVKRRPDAKYRRIRRIRGAGQFEVAHVRVCHRSLRGRRLSGSAGAASGSSPAQPDHCDIQGALDQRVGVDNLPYAIKFRLRIPTSTNWNGKFIFTGGGANGTVANGLTASGVTGSPLALGYAIVATDSGHDNAVDNLPEKNGTRTFLFDQQARVDFAYNSYGRVTGVSKAIINAYAGRVPDKSYLVGCSVHPDAPER